MKVAFSCAGEGFGHVSRVVSFAQGLAHRYELVFFAPESVQDYINRNLPGVSVITIPYFHLAKKGEQIDYLQTARQNVSKVFHFRREVRGLRRQLRSLGIQAVVSDFEPFLPAAARSMDLPVLQVNHPGVVVNYASLAPDAVTAKIIARTMMGHYDRHLFVSFYNGDVGPILRDQFFSVPNERGDYYVVYVKSSYRNKVTEALARLGVDNYMLFPNTEHDFATALAGCKGLISSAGHQSLSEAITLGKPVFAIPQRGQFEQRLNAEMLVRSGWGMKGRFSNLNRSLAAFVRQIDSFPRYEAARAADYRGKDGVKFRFTNDRNRAVEMIDSFLQSYAGKDSGERFLMNVQHGVTTALHSLGLAG